MMRKRLGNMFDTGGRLRCLRWFGGLGLMLASLWLAPAAAQTEPCQFRLGFKDLRDAIGADVVGDCKTNEAQAENGDSRQATTKGELVWRKASNTTAFTNGNETWVLGPVGLQKRYNSERFAWEPDAGQFTVVGGGSAPSPPRPASSPAPSPSVRVGPATSPTPEPTSTRERATTTPAVESTPQPSDNAAPDNTSE
jgi:hypothetical protein